MAYEASKFVIERADLSVDKPMEDTFFDLLIDYRNDGNKDGVLQIQIVVTKAGAPAGDPLTITSDVTCNANSDCPRWRYKMPQHEDPEASVTITILDMNNEPIADEITYSVSKISEDSSDGSL